jgi:very-short-patch-repair endonuclease
MAPQAKIGRYRVDFLLTQGDGPEERRPLIVECDGHSFHERTKEQASRDRARDRDLQAEGYPVFRFTGSHIWGDVLKHAHQALDYFYGEAN